MGATVRHDARVAFPTRPAGGLATAGLLCLAFAIVLVLQGPQLRATLAGTFSDPDDAMRLVEVRAWLAGQSWYDLTVPRLDPPTGASMHWSRLVDVPNAFLIRLFGLVTDRPETWDAVALPLFWLALLLWGMTRLAATLVGRPEPSAALLGTLLSGGTLVQFAPGRIGHHAPAIVVLVLAADAVLRGLEKGRGRQAALAGALVASGLAINLETLPFLAVLIGVNAAVWCLRGAPAAPALRCFGLGLGAALPFLFAVDVTPSRWFAPICDALGIAHLVAGIVAALGFVGLAAIPLASVPRRVAAATIVALAAGSGAVLASPACLHGPFAGVDPLVRSLWLDKVAESQPMTVWLQQRPALAAALLGSMGLGILACIVATVRTRALARSRWAVVTTLASSGLLLGFWQVRVLTAAAPLALCGGIVATSVLADRFDRRGLAMARTFASLAIVPFTATAWLLMMPRPAEHRDPARFGADCLDPAALAPLAALEPGRVVAPINVGSHLLAFTAHQVFAAPYHRNNDGNRFAFDVFLAAPEGARALLAARNVDVIVTCPPMGETAGLAAIAPASLAARLESGAPPAFLRPLQLGATPYQAWAVLPARPQPGL